MDYPQRKPIRLRGYDYSQGGLYFVTICVHRAHRHKNLLARCEGDTVRLNRFGHLAWDCWEAIPAAHPFVELESFVVMPNHLHLLVRLVAPLQTEDYQAQFGPLPPNSLSEVMRAYKSLVKREIGKVRGESTPVWQRRFYDRIVRTEFEEQNVRRYIAENPLKWTTDRCHPDHPQFELAWQDISPDPDFAAM